MNEEIKFDTNEDILFQIAMITYERHNSHIANINDNLGDMYSYKDLEETEKCELEDEKNLLELAINQLQKENQQLKSQLEQTKEEVKAVNRGLKKVINKRSTWKNRYYKTKKKLKQSNDIINEIRKYLDGACEMSCYTKSLSLDSENIDDLYNILNKRGGTDE